MESRPTPSLVGAQRQERSICLAPEDFWSLRALIRDVETVELRYFKARVEFERNLEEARRRRDAALAAITQKYGLEHEGEYRLDDATCALVQGMPSEMPTA